MLAFVLGAARRQDPNARRHIDLVPSHIRDFAAPRQSQRQRVDVVALQAGELIGCIQHEPQLGIG